MKKKKVVKKGYDYRRTFLVFAIVFSIIIGISTYWIYAYKHKHPYLEDNIINYKIDDYVKINGNIVSLENIDNKVANDFMSKQNKLISSNKIIDTDITKTIYKNILSIKIDMEKFTSSKLGQLCSKAYQEGYEQALKDIKNNVR